MNNVEIALMVGHLQAEVASIKASTSNIELKVDALVNANMLAKGGKKMLYKVGAASSAVGGVVAWMLEHGVKLLS
jgi:prefoldin subunit 5